MKSKTPQYVQQPESCHLLLCGHYDSLWPRKGRNDHIFFAFFAICINNILNENTNILGKVRDQQHCDFSTKLDDM